MNTAVDDSVVQSDAEARIVDALLARGRLKEADLLRARQLQREAGGGLLSLLARLGLVSERDHAETSAQVLGLPLLDARQLPSAPPPALADTPGLSLRFLKQFHACPLALEDGVLDLWLADPHDGYVQQAVQLASGCPVRVHVGLRSEVDDLVERWFGQGRSAMGAIVETADGDAGAVDDIEHLRDLASEAPVIRLVNLLIQRAVELRASDIHVEPFENRLKVRYRVDGVLVDGESPPVNLTAAVISRIKIMARLNIAERRLPQDGRIMLRVQGKELDLRVSTVPTAHGESVVMRLLDRETVVFDFHRLGFTDAFLPQFRKVLEQPHGILLVTGPTGSGKTTTLYAALDRLNDRTRNIMTVEDPIEYSLDGIGQVQVNPQAELGFARGLRAILRQDPDVIMVGEIRDRDTAQIAAEAAMTGHLVLSTLHTTTAIGAVSRLIDLGVERFLLAPMLVGLVAQRLVRRLCPHCRRPDAAGPAEAALLEGLAVGERVFRATGCPACQGQGYAGRLGLYEVIAVSRDLEALIHGGAAEAELTRAARRHSPGLLADGLRNIRDANTTVQDVARVFQEE